MTNIGTLLAFVIVCAAVLIMRQDEPGRRAAVPRAVLSVRADPRHPDLPAADVLAAGGELVPADHLDGDRLRRSTSVRLRPVEWRPDEQVPAALPSRAASRRDSRNGSTEARGHVARACSTASRLATRFARKSAPAVAAFTQKAGRPPGLGIVLVGDNPASEVYVRNKLKSAGETGCCAELHAAAGDGVARRAARGRRSAQRSDEARRHPRAVAAARTRWAHDAERRVFDAIAPEKDVDGFHPDQRRLSGAEPRDARRVHAVGRHRNARAIEHPIAGARAVVIGRSDIVGKPMALLLLHRHATVTIAHSKTEDLPQLAAEADILVAAIGRPGFVTKPS